MNSDNVASESSVRTGPLFAVMLVGGFVAFLNQTLVNTALPQMMETLQIDAATADWLITIYMLVNGIVIPVTAYLLERFTTRQLFLSALGIFTVGTLICGIAPYFSLILVGRVIQAAGAGIMFPLMTSVIFNVFPLERRGAAMGILGVAMNFAPAIGPTLSGWVVEHYSWRVLFFIIFPIALINLIVAFFLMRNVTETGRPKLDVLGVILSTVGFGGLLYGFSTAGNAGWSSPTVISTLVVGVISLLLFVWRQMTVGHPILEFRIFRYPIFTLTTVINVVVTMAMFSGMILLPLYTQTVRGFTPFEAGLMLLPGGIVMGIMSPITGRLFDKYGAKWLAISGLFITIITTYALTRLHTNTAYGYVITVFTIRMFGMSLLMMPIFTAGLNALPMSMNSYGTAMVNTIRMIAGAVGMALFVSIMSDRAATHLEFFTRQGVPVTDALTREATAMGINDSFMVATILTIISFVLAFFLKNTAPGEQQEKAKDPAVQWKKQKQPT
ncbi:DHA2 family efflux MFS transporter permease subunit [Brevibacillus fulvus]|uniref:EmrB/QacA subfamily drug resistance transporter n=1 Tax=Brevibacillus fulvus TaxID=1125967 RepID=A0A939BV69_9BACL|nr:DHA2 family efflux MFS transporter permease subunit [Brevibacillus fulvus]MBM7590356.1 EmrB/QacA subfamily drug resistance transporter [Brevibacillus fulvus]